MRQEWYFGLCLLSLFVSGSACYLACRKSSPALLWAYLPFAVLPTLAGLVATLDLAVHFLYVYASACSAPRSSAVYEDLLSATEMLFLGLLLTLPPLLVTVGGLMWRWLRAKPRTQ